MSQKGKKRSKSNPPATLKASQITFEDTQDRPPRDTESRVSKGSKASKSKSRGGEAPDAASRASKSSIGSDEEPGNLQQSTPKEDAGETEISTIKEPRGPFTPIVYTFRVPAPQPSKGVRRGMAKSPPYNLQLDHTLAVIWTLFSSEEAKKPLGIAQLQWALEFLKGIINRKGEHPKDISLCIDAIQEELLQQYSDLVDDIKAIKIPCYSELETCNKPQSAQSCSKSEEGNFACDSDTCVQKFGVDDDDDKSEDFVTKTIPFSINYADMIKKSPPCVEQLYKRKQGSVSSTGPHQKVSGTGFQLDQDMSRENMVEFLKNWRREQVEKIQSELKRLRSIENFIGNVDNNDNFTPYVDDKQLDDLMSVSKTSKSVRSEKR